MNDDIRKPAPPAREVPAAAQSAEPAPAEEGKQLPLFGIALALALAAAAFFSGIEIGREVKLEASLSSLFSPAAESAERVDMSAFWEVWALLEEKFVASTTTDPLTDEEKIHGAIAGLVRAYGDPYTVFLPPEEAQMFEEEISGNFEGVGMEVGMRDEVLTVIAPLPDTPAERAGVRSGDMIVRIDGKSTEGMSVDQAVKLIRGERGTEVVLTLYREGETEFLEVPIVRDRIAIPTLTTEQQDGVFIIRLFNFSALAEAMTQDALRQFIASGSDKLVIDLRGNPGGYLQSAVNIASFFLPVGKVVVREDYGEGRRERLHRSLGRDITQYRDFETVVLVDGGSASASEILAGALNEHGVATLIGMQTFGKGSVQELVHVEGDASLKVTVARWLTPNGTSISDGGLTPDQVVPYTNEDREAERDPQLDAAIEYLTR